MSDLSREQIEQIRATLLAWAADDASKDEANSLCDMALRLAQAERERDEARELAYVPGMWECAKCGCVVVSTLISAETGQFAANRELQRCPNDCGPMWRRTERKSGNELIDRLDTELDKCKEAEARVEQLEAALRKIDEWRPKSGGFDAEDDPYQAMAVACKEIARAALASPRAAAREADTEMTETPKPQP